MAEVKLRFNPDSEEVELVVDGTVAISSGSDVFESWVDAYNEKHPRPVPEPVVVEVPVPAAPVEEAAEETPPVEENSETEGVDSEEKE